MTGVIDTEIGTWISICFPWLSDENRNSALSNETIMSAINMLKLYHKNARDKS